MAPSTNEKPSQRQGGSKAAAKKKAAARKRNLLIAEFIVLILVIIGLVVFLKFSRADQDKEFTATTEQVTAQNEQITIELNDLSDEAAEMVEKYTNVALFGVDNRSNGNYSSGNSDTIMIMSINNETKDIKLVSVFRDTYMDIGGGKFNKCNAAYAYGGAQQAVAMLNKNLDMNITEYVTVDFRALVEVIDLLGGVEMYITDEVAKYMNASYIDEVSKVTGVSSSHVKSGKQILDGVQTAAYCRIRYTSGMDFERAYRQRTVVKLIIEKAKQASVSDLNKVINTMFSDVSTSFTTSELIALASGAMDYEVVGDEGFPFDKCTGQVGEKSIVVACDHASNVEKLYEYLFGMSSDEYEPSSTVTSISEQIKSDTGKTAADAEDYGGY